MLCITGGCGTLPGSAVHFAVGSGKGGRARCHHTQSWLDGPPPCALLGVGGACVHLGPGMWGTACGTACPMVQLGRAGSCAVLLAVPADCNDYRLQCIALFYFSSCYHLLMLHEMPLHMLCASSHELRP